MPIVINEFEAQVDAPPAAADSLPVAAAAAPAAPDLAATLALLAERAERLRDD